MSFAHLLKNAPTEGRIKLKGGQTQGHLEKPSGKITVDKYTPTLGKGSEYAAKFKAEEDKAYFESVASTTSDFTRLDVTSGESLSQLHELEELTSIGTLPNLRELHREELTEVYQRYTFKPLEPIEHLEPIFNEREQILRQIENNQVCIIKGPTGCGKSTQIPQFILDSHVGSGTHCNIVVTQPRRIAAITIAQRVCEERNWEVGGLVGYQVGLDKKANEDTRLLYCTTGVLLEKLINTKHLNDYTHIILDEVHEREEDMDFTMLIVKRLLRTNSPNVKVILMSATIDVSRFAEYFKIGLRDGTHSAPSYEIKRQSSFTVQVHYLDSLRSLGDIPFSEAEPNISKDAYMMVPMMIRAFNSIDLEDYKQKRSHEEKGAVLIFLPGLYQIETLFDILETEDKKCPKDFNLWVCPLHSSITKDEQENVRKYAPPGKRKIILSTNIAESSITIPDVKYVIDFCLTKHLVADPITGFTSLQLGWASHTNCLQREGRVGRVQDGRVYRLVPKGFFLFKMAKESTPELQRCPLDVIVLKCKKLLEEECPLKLISGALDPPDLTNYEKTILKLKEIGALRTTCNGNENDLDGDLTFIGKVMAAIPLDIHITKLILLGHIFDVLEDAIIMGCAMSVRNIFSEPFQKRLDAYNHKLLWADTSESDSIAYLNAYVVWRTQTGVGKFKRSVSSEDAWARRQFLQIKHLKEVARQEEDIKKRLGFLNIERQRGNQPLWGPMEKPLILKLVLAGAFYPHYFSRSAQNPNAESEAVKTLAGHSPYNCVYLQNMPHPAPLYFDQVRDALRQLGVSEDVQFYHDDSRKLIVAFNRSKTSSEQIIGNQHRLHSNIPGDIVMPVYRAIKLRQLNVPIKVRTLTASEIKEKLNRMSSKNSTSSMNSVGLSEQKAPIGHCDEYLQIQVCHVNNAGNFYCHNKPVEDTLKRIYFLLNGTDSLRPVTGDIMDDLIYAAPYKSAEEEEFSYYRAKIKNIKYDNNVLWVKVFFIDYGNSTKMAGREIREIGPKQVEQELEKIPPCALECTLAEVCPSVWSAKGASGEWSDEANLFVKKLIVDRKWIIKVYSYVNNVAYVHLYLRDNTEPSDTEPWTLNKELIKKGYADHKEESYFSKVNHAKRKELQEKGELNASEINIDGDSSRSQFFTQDLMSLPTTSGRFEELLKGPNSPLEMKVYSLVHCSSQKEVKVEWNSVNSVLLDTDPTDPHERFVIAGSVSQSPDGSKLTLNHTTVLPNMHGLAALVCLIFAPKVELRTDENLSRYTGALCGLGMKSSGCPVFSENDMEINFDVEFSNEDLLSVNKLRYWMNYRFSSEDAEDMPESEIIKTQKNIKSFAISLLKRVRPSVKVYYNTHPFMWNLVPEELLYNAFPMEDTAYFSKCIYQLHHPIELKPDNDATEIIPLLHKVERLETSLASGMPPRELKCELCDVVFEYWAQLRLHLSTSYHEALVKWLTSRAKVHRLPITKSTSAKIPSKMFS